MERLRIIRSRVGFYGGAIACTLMVGCQTIPALRSLTPQSQSSNQTRLAPDAVKSDSSQVAQTDSKFGSKFGAKSDSKSEPQPDLARATLGEPQLPPSFYGLWQLESVAQRGIPGAIAQQNRRLELIQGDIAQFSVGDQVIRRDRFSVKRSSLVSSPARAGKNGNGAGKNGSGAAHLLITFESDPQEAFVINMPDSQHLSLQATSDEPFLALYARVGRE